MLFLREKNSSTISIFKQVDNNLVIWAFQMDNPTDHFIHDQEIIEQSMLFIDDLNHNTDGLNTSGGIYWDIFVSIS